MRPLFPALSLTALAAGACTSVGGPGVSSYYDCGDSVMLKVDYVGDDMVQVQVNSEKPIPLRRVVSASGAKFGGERHTFWDKGSEASWTVGRMVPMQCRKVAVPR